jgi:hypothetical protein
MAKRGESKAMVEIWDGIGQQHMVIYLDSGPSCGGNTPTPARLSMMNTWCTRLLLELYQRRKKRALGSGL